MNKNELRKSILLQRNSLSKSIIKKNSFAVAQNFFSVSSLMNGSVFGSYLPIGSEVYTNIISEKLFDLKKSVCVPVLGNNGRMNFSLIHSMSDSQEFLMNRFGIREPINPDFVSPEQIDVFIIPGIVFSSAGGRIGWGKGYYDCFFSKINSGIKVGLGFDFQVLNDLPSESHDLRLDYVVTDKRVIRC